MRLKRSVLDQLDDNTKIVSRMKAYFPSEYGLYSSIGAVIVPHEEAFIPMRGSITNPVSPWFNKIRPSFGAVVTGIPGDETKGKDDLLMPRLTHFMKIDHPMKLRKRMFDGGGRNAIQLTAPTSDLYLITAYYDERDWARVFPRKSREDWKLCKFYERAFAVELPIEITKDGDARPLRIWRDKVLKFRHDSICVKRWDYPYTKECLDKSWKELGPEAYIMWQVGVALCCYEEAQASMIQVRATKKGVCTLVNVNVEDTPAFFDDREDVVGEDGVKKRIFHIVRAHERVGSRGVRVHFRGLRKFLWNGYEVEISVPGRDHIDIKEFNVTAINEDAVDDQDDAADVADVGAWLVANQKARYGAMVGKSGPLAPRPWRERPEARP